MSRLAAAAALVLIAALWMGAVYGIVLMGVGYWR